ncbi:ATP-binding protein [Kitasatospora sp. NPDC052896]|uniref:ATP-binding protein n=1 Tax=Kitasatospora sp. NPDC052896 TaxID=3364061 RepID=UPI0037CC7982
MVTITLVERENELAALGGLLRASMAGRCRVALVSGVVGSGKTELLHTFAESAMEQGAVLLTALASAATQSVSMGVLGQLFQPAQKPPAGIESVFSLLATVLAGAASDALPAPAGFRLEGDGLASASVLDSLCAGLARVAATHPVVIGVDDVQYADVASLDCLLYLMRRLRYARVLFVLNESEHEQHRNPLFRVELLRQPGFRRIRLGPLSVAGVERMLALELGADRVGARGARYHAVSGGNPLLVRALLDDGQMAGAVSGGEPPDGAPEVGDAFGQAVLACLHRGNPAMLAVARALAVLDTPSSPEMVERLLDLDPQMTAQVIDDLEIAGFIAGGGFRHPGARAAVLGDLSAERRATLHLAAARLLHAMQGPATGVARHLIAAGQAADPWAPEVLRVAAGQALRDDQAELAIEFLELAEQTAGGVEERLATAMLLVQAEWRVDPARSARHLTSLGAALRDGRLSGRQAAVLVRSMLWHGRLDDAVEALALLGREAEQSQEIASELRTLTQWLRASYPELLDRLAASPTGGRERTSLSSFQSRAAGLLSAVLTGGGDESTVSGAEQILQAAVLDDTTLESIEAALLALVYADQPARAVAWCEPLLEEASARQVPTWAATLSAVRAEAAIRQGDAPAAERCGRAALRQLPARSWGVAVGAPVASLVLAKSAMGKHDEAAALVSQPTPNGMLGTRYGLHYLYARGHHYFVTERFDAAVSDFLTCGDLMGRWGVDLPALVPWRSAAAAALLRLGEREQAERLAEEQLVKVGGERSRSRGITLRTLAQASGLSRRPALLREAVANLQYAGDQLELAHALADLGFAHRSLGESDRSRSLADQALRLAGECEAEPLRETLSKGLADPVARIPEQRGSRRTGVASLSDAELRVAALASLGFTNREIANQLYITVSTVEQHLTRVYRKLKVGRRADLPTDLQVPLPEAALAESARKLVVSYRSKSDKVELNSCREAG